MKCYGSSSALCALMCMAAGGVIQGLSSLAGERPTDGRVTAMAATRPSRADGATATTSRPGGVVGETGTSNNANYTLSTDAATMGNIVEMLRYRYRLTLCFEDVQYDPAHDIVRLKDVIARYHEMSKRRPLSVREQEMLTSGRQLLEGGASPELVFDVASERYTDKYKAASIGDLLTTITKTTPYQWRIRNGTYVIYPRKSSSLAFVVSLDVTDVGLAEVVQTIVAQAANDNRININATQTFEPSRALQEARVPRLKLANVSAMDAVCRAVEAANRSIVWSVGGYVGRRNMALAELPPQPAIGE